MLEAHVDFQSNANGALSLSFVLVNPNNPTYSNQTIATADMNAVNSGVTQATLVAVFQLQQGDLIQVTAVQTSGVSLLIRGSETPSYTSFSLTELP